MMILEMIAFLVTDILICIFQFTTITLGGYMLILFFRNRHLRKSGGLRLIFFLTICDVICAIGSIPYNTYLILGWNLNDLYYDTKTVVYISVGLIIEEKIHLTFTLSMALDRLIAVCYPAHYRRKNARRYALYTLLIAICIACFDVFLEFYLTEYREVHNCAAIGCFLDPIFLEYWGISNMVMGCTKLVITVFVIIKIRQMSKTQAHIAWTTNTSSDTRFHQANKLSFLVLSVSVSFITIPSILVAASNTLEVSIFSQIGPFYQLFLLMAATCNTCIYLICHSEMRKCSNHLWKRKATLSNFTSTNID